MSVKAHFVVIVFGEQSYPVVVRFEPNEYVPEIKKLIVAELKSGYPPFFDNAAWGWINLKTLDGNAIMENRMPEGDEFLAELKVPESHLESWNLVNSEVLWIKKLKDASYFETEPDNLLFFPTAKLPLDQSYLNLKKMGDDTFDSPTFFVIAPTGSGKTKLIVDLALIKDEYVIYVDCKRHENLFESVKQKISDEKKCSTGLSIMEELLRKLLYCSTLLVTESIVKTAEDFFKYWAGQDTSILIWILDAVIPADRYCSTSFIIAFDECQELLGSVDNVTQDLKASDNDQELSSSHSSLFALLMHGRAFFQGTRFVFSGTSLRLSRMSKDTSSLRKNLHNILRPPLFDEHVAHKYLVLNEVDENVAKIAAPRLIGRALASQYFIDAYKQEEKSLDDDLKRFGVSNVVELKVQAILNRVLERIKNYFLKHIDQSSLSVKEFFSLQVQVGVSKMTRQEVLVDLMNNKEVLAMKSTRTRNRDEWELRSFVESINTIFLPIEETRDGFRYHCHDLLAFHAMVEILSAIEPNFDVKTDLHEHSSWSKRVSRVPRFHQLE